MGCGISTEDGSKAEHSTNNAESIVRSNSNKNTTAQISTPSRLSSSKSLKSYSSRNIFKPLEVEEGSSTTVIYPEPVFVVKISIPGGEKTFIDIYAHAKIVTTFVDSLREVCHDRKGALSTLFHVCVCESRVLNRNDTTTVRILNFIYSNRI